MVAAAIEPVEDVVVGLLIDAGYGVVGVVGDVDVGVVVVVDDVVDAGVVVGDVVDAFEFGQMVALVHVSLL